MTTATREPSSETTRWRPLDRVDRRVVGVLVEKAKTTPENYPLSLNALVNGCNQKSNRFPQMQLDEAQVEEAIDRLRAIDALSIVQGDGRVDKYRHRLYEWLGADKVELAVMAELLLRGAQTLGELRGRAARMEAIKDVAALQPIVDTLLGKKLVLRLTPPGRGCVVTHALYQPQELDKLRSQYETAESQPPAGGTFATPPPCEPTPQAAGEVDLLRAEVAALRSELAAVRADMENQTEQIRQEINRLSQRSEGG